MEERINKKIAMINKKQREFHIIRPVLANESNVFVGHRVGDERGQIYALKLVDISYYDFSQEYDLVQEFEYIEKIIKYGQRINFEDNGCKYILIEMKYYQHTDLFNYLEIRNFDVSEEMIIQILLNSLMLLDILRCQNVFHGRFIFENMLIESEHPLNLILTGFSSAFHFDDRTRIEQYRSFIPCYTAPEFLERKICDSQSNIWSLGVLIYLLIFKKFPFELELDDSCDDALEKIKHNDIELQEGIINNKLLQFLEGALEIDPNRRITIEYVIDLDFLQHNNDFQDNHQLFNFDQDNDQI